MFAALVACLTGALGASAYDLYTGGIYYSITEYADADPVASVENNGSINTYSGVVTIPATVNYNGKTCAVTSISYQAFKGCTGLTEVNLPESIMYFSNEAFSGCTSLTSITIPASIYTIYNYVFTGCTALQSVTCLRPTAPSANTNNFSQSTYTSATLYVPAGSLSSYQSTAPWSSFTTIRELAPDLSQALSEALNIDGGTISFTSSGDYPWTVVSEGDRTFAQSSNAGVGSSSSELTATVTVNKDSFLSFDFKAWGEGSSTAWDKCVFMIDDVAQFTYGALKNDWETYVVQLPAGTHTLVWYYSKDSSVNPTGDYFAVDNVAISNDISSAVNEPGGNIQFLTSGAYPWVEVTAGGRTYAQSGNAGVSNSTSVMTAQVSVAYASLISFDFKAWGEGSSTAWDKCVFMIDDVAQFTYGARQNDWEKYVAEINPGTHTLVWYYTKDTSVDPTGDYFVVDNFAVMRQLRGDVNSDGDVNISDVAALIDYLLSGNASSVNLNSADVDLDGDVGISDVATLIDYLLGDHWPGERVYTVDGVSFTMIEVEGGTFTMGLTGTQSESEEEWALPTHTVTLSSYNIGKTEVTQELWQAVMGYNPSAYPGDPNRPVESISWNDCQSFITKLNQMTGENFRLPTEAEWEFAARGGNKTQGYMYSGSNDLDAVAWYSDNNNNTSSFPVGQKDANELGIYDMSGNLWEWCQDWFGDYTADPQVNPTGPSTGSDRVVRGGAFFNGQVGQRVWFRNYTTPTNSAEGLGMRLAK